MCGTKITMWNENRQRRLSQNENHHGIEIINGNYQRIEITNK
jgi:hypothetical protein